MSEFRGMLELAWTGSPRSIVKISETSCWLLNTVIIKTKLYRLVFE